MAGRLFTSESVTEGHPDKIADQISDTVLDHARAKLARKGCDLLVANEVGVDKTFGQDTSTAYLLRPDNDEVTVVGPTTKRAVAEAVWRAVADLLAR